MKIEGVMKTTINYLSRFTAGAFGLVLVIAIAGNWLEMYGIDVVPERGPNGSVPSTIVMVLLLAMGSLLAIYQIALFVLHVLTLRKEPSPAVLLFLETGIVKHLTALYRLRLTSAQRKLFSLTAWGVFMYCVIAFLAIAAVFEKSEVFFHVNNTVWNYSRDVERERLHWKDDYQHFLKNEPVRRLFYETEDNNYAKYLRDVYKMARDLKAAGVKAVVADAVPRQWFVGVYPREENDFSAIINRIDSLGVVIWGRKPQTWGTDYFEPHIRVRMAQSQARNVTPVYSALNGVGDRMLYRTLTTIIHWQPIMRQQTFAPTYECDVAVMAAQKYFDIPDTCALVTLSDAVSVGGLRIPISSSGTAYCKSFPRYSGSPLVMASRGIGGVKGFEYHPDSLRYNVFTYASGQWIGTSPKDTVKDLLRFREHFEGSVVVINWMNASFNEEEVMRKMMVVDVISSVIRGTLYTKDERVTHLLTILAIVLIAVISAFSRARWIVVASVFLVAGITAAAVWLFAWHRIVFDPLYPIAATAIAAVIYSLLRYMRETA
jgi:hypothetical protein